jgi:alpha/beta hydrolase fold
MMLGRSFIATSAAGIVLAASALAFAETRENCPQTCYAPVNGLNLYYEIHGAGEPLILLHGGLGATEMFGEILPLLSKTRRVIAVDLQSHGRTADIDRPLSFDAMADDIAALIEHLGIEKADVMGLLARRRRRPAQRHPASRRSQEAGARLDRVQTRWMVPRDRRRDGADGPSRRRADEADPDVQALCPQCAEARGLAGAAHQARRVAQEGL